MSVKVTVQGIQKVRNRIKTIRDQAKNPSGLVQRFSVLGFADVMDHFRKEEGATTSGKEPSPWRRLKSSTMARRRKGPRKGSPDRILQDTGRLRNSIVPGRLGSRKAIIWTNLKYAPIHQFGSGRVPARPFMWISSRAIDRMERAALNWVIRGR